MALTQLQKEQNKNVSLHWAFIKDQNDRIEDVEQILDVVEELGLKAKFNLVRYNPHDQRHGVESDEEHLQTLFDLINNRMKLVGSRIVPRVGYDVKASCGMFVTSQSN